MMAGLLLARAGVDTIVLEKHGDFLRDFRGDTVHPSTLELMHELGVLDAFLTRPHQKLREIGGDIDGQRVRIADFSHLPTACKFVALMPQWDFLDFLADEARKYPTFRLLMNAEAIDVLRADGRVTGVRAKTPDGEVDVEATLTIGADGRHSVVRDRAGLTVETFGAPIDVLWMRLSRHETDRAETLGIIRSGRVFVMLNRGDYWQCAYVIPKGGADKVRAEGIEKVRATIGRMVPTFAGRLGELEAMDDLKLLTVGVDRLETWWKPGVLCIGDAAHTMSPIGGVGINIAIQDAVAAANLLSAPLREGRLRDSDLAAVQARRLFPARATQAAQVFLQDRIIAPSLARAGGTVKVPFIVKLMQWLPVLRRLPARLIALGVRPEHVRTKAV